MTAQDFLCKASRLRPVPNRSFHCITRTEQSRQRRSFVVGRAAPNIPVAVWPRTHPEPIRCSDRCLNSQIIIVYNPARMVEPATSRGRAESYLTDLQDRISREIKELDVHSFRKHHCTPYV